jgi:hypothetical protein
MRNLVACFVGMGLLATLGVAGCSKLGLGGKAPPSHELPSAAELKTIRYMTRAPGPDGRRIYVHLSEAKSCRDLQIALRWDRPPDVRGGPFDDKMVYVTDAVPPGLATNSEVFVSGSIEQGQSLPSGGSVWAVKLRGGGEVQAVETAEYSAKQEEAQQSGGPATVVHPYTPGRMFCGYGVYQGDKGMALNGHGRVPLVSVLFAMDRRR